MKKLIILSLASIGLFASSAQALECTFKEIEHTNIRYAYPIYKANVSYFFSKLSREAYALANWEFDTEKTRECFNFGKEQYPSSKLLVPPVSVSKVEFKILGSDVSWELDTYPLPNGHWNASSIMIPIRHSAKEIIADAITKNLRLIEFRGDPRMRISICEKKTVGIVKCTEKEESLGVLNLFKRLGEIKTTAEMVRGSGVKTEEALQDFLGKCVEFSPVEANSFTEFDQEQKLNSRIKKGEFSLMGYVEKDTYLEMPGITNQNATIQDL